LNREGHEEHEGFFPALRADNPFFFFVSFLVNLL
jgi:hypothetical protein